MLPCARSTKSSLQGPSCPGRESGAGYKCWTREARLCVSVRRLDSRVAKSGRDQIVKFGYNKSEIRSKNVSSTSPSGHEVLSSTGMTCALCTMRLPVVPEATTPPKLTPKDVNYVDKEKLGMEQRSHRDDEARELDWSGFAGPVQWRGAPRIPGEAHAHEDSPERDDVQWMKHTFPQWVAGIPRRLMRHPRR